MIVGVFIYNHVKISVNRNEQENAITIIGGADGPTSVFLAGKLGGSNDVTEYKSISMDEAKAIFEGAGDYIILDVRRADEFAEGHIPGAINVANEDIGADKPVELPEEDKTIYVYCRSGRRSKEAAAKLAAIGYTNIIECGGILDWTGDLEK
ncbi:MAG: rhodanese-like domain-containing protein [Lachnospiraceae bacterium]|nr:rhodanese-like domain-containing protein [Lachnospiraceae bacterium]